MAEGIESTTIIPGKPPVDVLSSDGKDISGAGASLGKIFDLAEAGKPIAEAIQEVNDKKEPEQKKEVVEKKEEKKVETSALEKKLEETQSKKDDPDEEVTREKLLEQTSQKKEEKKDDAGKKDDVAPDPDAVPEEDLKVLPQDKPKTAKRIQALLKKIDDVNTTFAATKKDADERAEKLAELEEKLKNVQTVDPKVQEEVKTQLDELAMFRRRYQLDQDPEVKTRFESRSTEAEGAITSILTKRNAGPALLKLIADTGGWSKFSDSNAPVTFNKADGTTETITSSQAAENILQALPLGERKQIESAMMEQIATEREKARFFEEETKKAKEYFSKRDAEAAKGNEAQQQAIANAQKIITEFQTEVVKKHDWLKERQVPDNATQEQKSAIEDDNRYTRQLHGLLKKNLSAKDIPTMLAIVEDSVAYYAERRTTARLLTENAALKKSLEDEKASQDKFRRAASSISKPGSISSGAAQQEKKKGAPVGLEAALASIEAGGRESDED